MVRLLDTSNTPIEHLPVFTLAYLGDAWYELWCRQKVLALTQQSENAHRTAIRMVCCQAQAMLAETILPLLDADEQQIYNRGKNYKNLSCPKNATMKDYRAATGFECLIGYWFLTKNLDRFTELIEHPSPRVLIDQQLNSSSLTL